MRFHEEAEKDPSLEDEAREAFSKMEQGDSECIELWKWFVEISIAEFKKVYELIGADFESWNGESFYFDKTDEVVNAVSYTHLDVYKRQLLKGTRTHPHIKSVRVKNIRPQRKLALSSFPNNLCTLCTFLSIF